MSYFENKPLFMSLKLRFTDIVIVYFYDILIDQSIPWLNQVTLNKVKSRNNRRFYKVGGPMTNLLENVIKRRTKIVVMLAANQMNEQPLENTFVPQDQDLVHWSSYLKKRLM